jgi:hypothetical protein
VVLKHQGEGRTVVGHRLADVRDALGVDQSDAGVGHRVVRPDRGEIDHLGHLFAPDRADIALHDQHRLDDAYVPVFVDPLQRGAGSVG